MSDGQSNRRALPAGPRKGAFMVDLDVVVVGGGIAGSALAAVLARAGRSVVVLEQSTEFRDRVRGEVWAPWGVAELQRLGLHDDLVAAGGHHSRRFILYDPAIPRPERSTWPSSRGCPAP